MTISPSTNHDRAIKHVESVESRRAALRAEYAAPPARSSVLNALHQEIGAHLKLADIHANLAVADAVDDLRNELVEALRTRADVILDAGLGDVAGVRLMNGQTL